MILPFLLTYWKLVAVGLLVAAVGGYVLHCESTKRAWAEAKAIGARQEAENARQALRDLKNKERSDENYARNLARLRADVKRLRNARGSLLPAPSADAPGSDPTRICFDRAALDLAISNYRAGILGLVEQGAAAVEGLDEARAWARER